MKMKMKIQMQLKNNQKAMNLLLISMNKLMHLIKELAKEKVRKETKDLHQFLLKEKFSLFLLH